MFHQLVLTGDLSSDIVTAEMQMWISLDFSQILAETLKTGSLPIHQNLLWVLKGWGFCCCGGFLVCLFVGFFGFCCCFGFSCFSPIPDINSIIPSKAYFFSAKWCHRLVGKTAFHLRCLLFHNMVLEIVAEEHAVLKDPNTKFVPALFKLRFKNKGGPGDFLIQTDREVVLYIFLVLRKKKCTYFHKNI